MAVRPQLPDFDVFEVLGVTPDDPPEAVKAAWRSRVKEHHPDTPGGSEEEIKRVNVAYEWLRDPTLRASYVRATRDRGLVDGGWSHPDAEALDVPYDGPRAERLGDLAQRMGTMTMTQLLDLVHGDRPDLRWSMALARGVEVTGRRIPAAAAVWQIRLAVRDRIEVLLRSPEVRATYDDELVGQVVSDRLADLVRGIVLLDVLGADARAHVTAEWAAVMGAEAEPPGDEPGIGERPSRLSSLGASWRRVPDGLRWLVVILAAGIYATLATALLPSRDAAAAIVLGFGVVATAVLARRSPRA